MQNLLHQTMQEWHDDKLIPTKGLIPMFILTLLAITISYSMVIFGVLLLSGQL